jgi:hypothetical protein
MIANGVEPKWCPIWEPTGTFGIQIGSQFGIEMDDVCGQTSAASKTSLGPKNCFRVPKSRFRALALGRLPIKATDALKWVFGSPKIRFRDPKSCIESFKWKFECLKRVSGPEKYINGTDVAMSPAYKQILEPYNVFPNPDNVF